MPAPHLNPALRASAESLAGRLPPLLLAAERVAASVAAGVHGRRREGVGEQFWQYRRYQAGDPAARIDWRASARTPHLLVREREWEIAQTALLWRDRSPSLDWRSNPALPTKRERAELLALALASLLLRGGERVGLAGQRPLTGRNALERLAFQLETAGGTDALPPPLPRLRHARLVLFGDFLDPVADSQQRLRALFSSGIQGIALQVLDPAELNLPYRGRVLFEGLEGEGDYLARRAENLREAYADRLQIHQQQLRQSLSRLGWQLITHCTEAPPEQALLQLYLALTHPLARPC